MYRVEPRAKGKNIKQVFQSGSNVLSMTAYRKSRTAAAIALPVLLTAILQWRSGAYSSDLATNSDEPAHVVSGLMVHDYAARLLNLTALSLPVNLRAFAEAYYVHYPKVAIGHWPPSFYLSKPLGCS